MEFEFDPEKSESNRLKHGVDFTDAQALWEDPFRVEIPALVGGRDIPERSHQDHLGASLPRRGGGNL